MKFLIFLLALAVYSHANEEIIPTVIGGANTIWGQFPASVIIQTPGDYCGGTVIDDLHVLTTASCVLNPRFEVIHPQWFTIIAGDIFFNPPSGRRVTRRASRIFVHQDYDAFTGDANLALIRLSERFPLPHNTINPAQRQTRIVRNGLSCSLIAFGRQNNITDSAFRTQQVNLPMPILDRDQCSNNWVHTNRLPERVLCGQTAGNAAPCTGSIGSGLYCNGLLTGVLSGGNFCNATPAIFQQVRAYRAWIDGIISHLVEAPQNFNPINMQGFPVVFP